MSENDSQVSVLEKPEAPKPSLKQRAASKIPLFGRYKKGEVEPREVLGQMVNEDKSDVSDQGIESPQELNMPSIEGNTPEERYEQMVRLTSPSKSDLEMLREKAAKKNTSDNLPAHARTFSAKDKLRHKALETYARVNGVEDLQAFNEMVIALEKSMTKTEYKHLEFAHEPSEQEKEKIIAEWTKKGYYGRKDDFRPNYDDDNSYRVNFSRVVPRNIERGDIPVLKEFLGSGENPVQALLALQKAGLEIYSLSADSEKTAQIAKILVASGSSEALTFLKNVADLPGYKYISDLNMYTLHHMLENGNIESYDADFFQKVAVLSPLIGTGITPSNLVEYKAIIDNPDRYRFVTTFLLSGYDNNRQLAEKLFSFTKELDAKGLLKPLSTCMEAQSSLGLGYEDLPDVNPDTLEEFLQKPETIDLLDSPEKQTFSRLMNYMDGQRSDPAQVDKLFEKRFEVVSAYNILTAAGVIDEKSTQRSSYRLVSQKILDLLKTTRLEEAVQDPEFGSFLVELRKQEVPLPSITDYYGENFLNGTIDLFNYRDTAKELGDDIYSIARSLSSSDYGIKRDAEGKISEYRYVFENKEFINRLKEWKVFDSNEAYYNASVIEQLKSSPFLKEGVLSRVPEDIKAQWVKDGLNLSVYHQSALLSKFGYRWNYVGEDGANLQIDFQKTHEIAQVFDSNPLFQKYGENLITIFADYDGDLPDLIQGGRPTRKLADVLLAGRYFDVLTENEFASLLTPNTLENVLVYKNVDYVTKQLLNFNQNFPDLSKDVLEKYDVISHISTQRAGQVSASIREMILDYEGDPKDLFEEKPTKLFIDTLISKRMTDELAKYLSDDAISYYEGTMKDMLQLWKGMPESLKGEILTEEPNFPEVSDRNLEKYRVAGQVIERIHQSPSAEIKRLQTELVNQLWKLDDPMTALEEVVGIFEKNNLPLVGKIYRVFETIYDNPNTPGGTTLEQTLTHNSHLSPVLREASQKQRREIIYRDLLKVHVESGNPQLRDYLDVLQGGEGLIGKVDTEGVDAFSERERVQFSHFLNKMDVLYQSSLFGRSIENRYREKGIDHIPTTSHLDMSERVLALKKNFRVRNGQRLTDRVSEMFLKPLGYTKIEEVIDEMERSKSIADGRNREYVNGAESLQVKAKDRFKGVNSSALLKILESGFVAGEYLGASAGSDLTPYDTDTSVILESDLTEGFKSAVQATLATSYGDIMLLIRNRGQFGNGADQFESFGSGVWGERHEGIRTGIPSTEIDGVVLNTFSEDKTDDLFIEIAQNGFYIPVTDRNGNIIFTPEDYDRYRRVFDGVSEYSSSPLTINRVRINEADYTFPSAGEVVAGTRAVLDQLAEDVSAEMERVGATSNSLQEKLREALSVNGVNLRGEFESSIYGAELVDTGSTGRFTNIPGERIDFDLSLQLDPNDSIRLQEIADAVKQALRFQEDKSHGETDYVQIRAIGSEIIVGETLDVDVGIGRRADYGIFASNEAVKQKLDNIKERYGEDVHVEVLANIVLAKKVLKEGGAYKKLEDGGMGGIGVENWILLNNGNILDAFQSFWTAAHENGNTLPYEEFAKRYKVFDAGTNIKYNTHDNFIQVLKPEGYQKMLGVIGGYLGYV